VNHIGTDIDLLVDGEIHLDRHLGVPPEPVGNGEGSADHGIGEAVLDGGGEMIDTVRPAAHVEGVGIGEERFPPTVPDAIHDLAKEWGRDIGGIPLLAEVELDGHQVTGAEDLVEADPIEESTELGEEILTEAGAKIHGEYLTGHESLLGSESVVIGMAVTLDGMGHPCQGNGRVLAIGPENKNASRHGAPTAGDFLVTTPVVCSIFDVGGDSQRPTETAGLRCLACLSDLPTKSSERTAYSVQATSLASLGQQLLPSPISTHSNGKERTGDRLG
jgi:hypothetical protein